MGNVADVAARVVAKSNTAAAKAKASAASTKTLAAKVTGTTSVRAAPSATAAAGRSVRAAPAAAASAAGTTAVKAAPSAAAGTTSGDSTLVDSSGAEGGGGLSDTLSGLFDSIAGDGADSSTSTLVICGLVAGAALLFLTGGKK
jgi:cell pole-organizing protein PopZ